MLSFRIDAIYSVWGKHDKFENGVSPQDSAVSLILGNSRVVLFEWPPSSELHRHLCELVSGWDENLSR